MMFSIIVPVYNAGESLAMCIQSVLDQSFGDWEMILVNDGSTDNSGTIVEQFLQKDHRIRAIHKHNEGQLITRRKGIELAKGEFLLFLDCDDYWHPDCLSILDAVIGEKSPDVIMFPAQRIGAARNPQEVICKISEKPEWVDKTFFYGELISGVNLNSLCLKAWRKSLFDGDNTNYSQFAKVCWGEDRVQLLHPITKANSIFYIPDVLYYYVDNPSSVTHMINLDRVPQMLSNDAFALLYSYMKLWGMDLPEYRETIAVQYLRNFINTYYKVRRSCKTAFEKKEFRQYDWNAEVSKKAYGYMFSRKLKFREKTKQILSRYFKI